MRQRERNRPSKDRLGSRHGLENPAHVVRTRLEQRLDAALDVVGAVGGVRPHDEDHVTLSSAGAEIKRRRRDALGIVEQAHGRVSQRVPFHDPPRPIRAHPVDDQYLVFACRVRAGDDRLQTPVDEGVLISARDDDRHERQLIRAHAQSKKSANRVAHISRAIGLKMSLLDSHPPLGPCRQ